MICTGDEMSLQEVVTLAFMLVGILFSGSSRNPRTRLEPNKPENTVRAYFRKVRAFLPRPWSHDIYSRL